LWGQGIKKFRNDLGRRLGAVSTGRWPGAALPGSNGGEDLSESLRRVKDAGDGMLVSATNTGTGMGYFTSFLDTEGNRAGLGSMEE